MDKQIFYVQFQRSIAVQSIISELVQTITTRYLTDSVRFPRLPSEGGVCGDVNDERYCESRSTVLAETVATSVFGVRDTRTLFRRSAAAADRPTDQTMVERRERDKRTQAGVSGYCFRGRYWRTGFRRIEKAKICR
ncbi:hypothetical protein ACI65C_003016 [Semiaphis heraclei]